jgi:hypothetical protein
MNDEFSNKKVLQRSRFRIWKSARLVTDGMVTADDGLHLSSVSLKHHVQVKKLPSTKTNFSFLLITTMFSPDVDESLLQRTDGFRRRHVLPFARICH